VLMDVQCCTSLDHDLHTSPPAVRRSLIPWSLRFVLAATVSDARGSRVLLRHGLGGTKPARRHRTTGGIFIRLGWALKEPMHYFASRGTAVARGTVPSRSRLAPTRDMSLGSRSSHPRLACADTPPRERERRERDGERSGADQERTGIRPPRGHRAHRLAQHGMLRAALVGPDKGDDRPDVAGT